MNCKNWLKFEKYQQNLKLKTQKKKILIKLKN